MTFLRTLIFSLSAVFPTSAIEGFDAWPAQALRSHAMPQGNLVAGEGHAEIVRGKGRSGNQCLKLTGGNARTVEWQQPKPLTAPSTVEFWAERWTRADPFSFHLESRHKGQWQKIAEKNDIVIGGFLTKVRVSVPSGAEALRLVCTSKAGVLIDDLSWLPDAPMRVAGFTTHTPVTPVMRRLADQPVMGFSVNSEGNLQPPALEAVTITWENGTRLDDIAALALVRGSDQPDGRWQETLAITASITPRTTLRARHPLIAEAAHFWLVVTLKDQASLAGRVGMRIEEVVIGGKKFSPPEKSSVSQRIGIAVRKRGDAGSKFYRIPGLTRSKKGTLLAVYDVRYHHAGDLPADIDIGISRSTDGGQTWGPMIIAIDQGKDPKHSYDGVGDPAILCDETTGRLWVAGLWSHGKRAWNGSGPGLKPEETGQLLLAYSDDDGITWSQPRNITSAVKHPSWRLLLNGPGAGICMRDGTLVFAAQYRSANEPATQGKPFSTILTSQDRGATWQLGTGVKIDTTEAQAAELPDGSLMLNCRDNRGGSRTVMVTRDLGKTWTAHPTDRSALREPVCMASLLRWTDDKGGHYYIFSNPDSTKARHHMTLKVSADAAMTWPEKYHTLYDERVGFGYSCLSPVDAKHIGVLYESAGDLLFLKFPFTELLPK
jgi:sialidase-1